MEENCVQVSTDARYFQRPEILVFNSHFFIDLKHDSNFLSFSNLRFSEAVSPKQKLEMY